MTRTTTYALTVSLGSGVTGTPSASQTCTAGDTVNYTYTLQSGYTSLVVTLDGSPAATSGSVTMNAAHALVASATPLVPWTGIKQLGVSGQNTVANSVATDASGNVYVAGVTDGGLDGNTLTGTADFFITKYDNSGVKQYTKQLGVSGADTIAYSVATDTSGNAYVAGWTAGGLDGNVQTGTQDFFVAKYNGSGTLQ